MTQHAFLRTAALCVLLAVPACQSSDPPDSSGGEAGRSPAPAGGKEGAGKGGAHEAGKGGQPSDGKTAGGRGGASQPPAAGAGGSGNSTRPPAAGAGGSGGTSAPELDIERSSVGAQTSPAVAEADFATFVSHINAFGLELNSAQTQANGFAQSNLIYSPISATIALGMTYAGARGETEMEMKTVLGDSFAKGTFHTASNRLMRALRSRNTSRVDGNGKARKVELNVVDSIFVERTLALESDFLDILSREYDSGVTKQDFIQAFEPARITINDWVAEQTKDKIKDLLPPGSTSELTRLVLVNALYFYGSWLKPFAKELTRDADFHTLTGSTVKVPTMSTGALFDYASRGDYAIAELPYEGEALRMTIVLPAEGKFESVRSQVTEAWLTQALTGLKPSMLALSLPKFEMTVGSFSLKEGLESLGMKVAFTLQADFGGITKDAPLLISDVLQKAFISVDEDGTEAAAATAVIVSTTGLPPEMIPFVVDRPFLFFIRDKNNTVLFAGHVVDPSKM